MKLTASVAGSRYYINYKMMKRKVKGYSEKLQDGHKDERKLILKEFSEMLDHQVYLTDSFCIYDVPLISIPSILRFYCLTTTKSKVFQ